MAKKEKVESKKSEEKPKEKKFQLLDAKGHDTTHCYKGQPVACAVRAWRAILRATDKKPQVIRLREHHRTGKERRVHIYKYVGETKTVMPDDEKTPEWLRGRTIINPQLEKQPVEHVNCTEAREPWLKGAKGKK